MTAEKHHQLQAQFPLYKGASCRDGWYDLIVKLFQKVDEFGFTQLIITGIKEKFGMLSIYYRWEEDVTFEPPQAAFLAFVRALEQESLEVCECCGRRHLVGRTSKVWIYNICWVCYQAKYLTLPWQPTHPLEFERWRRTQKLKRILA